MIRLAWPSAAVWAPWTDRKGKPHPVRTVVFAALWLPLVWLAWRWSQTMLGARPLTAAIHSTGYWAAWIFLVALAMTPAKAVFAFGNIILLRRMIGVAAACYAGLHLTLYAEDQNWRLGAIGWEILQRFYLTIGFVALLGLLVLAVTSTDGWVRRLGAWWRPLHKASYPLGVLALLHFFLQSKADVSQATVAAGVFVWLMLWRLLPVGRDRGAVPLLGLALAACVTTLATEWAWYRFGTRIDPVRVLKNELSLDVGLSPGGLVLLMGLALAVLAEMRRWFGTGFGKTALYQVGVYLIGAALGDVAGWALGWMPNDDAVPAFGSPVLTIVVWYALFAALGLVRFGLRAHRWACVTVDVLWVAAALAPVLALGMDARPVGLAAAAVLAAGALLMARRLWPASRAVAVAVVPLAVVTAYEAFALLS